MPYAKNKGADQPAHPRSLISAVIVRCRDYKNLTWDGCEVRIENSVPRVTVWHHEAVPSDAKQ